MATQADIDLGATALKNYVMQIDGWEANFVPWGTYESGSQLVLNAWDSSTDSDAAMKETACGMTLYKVISDAGYASRVTEEQCAAGAHAVLAACRGI